MDLSTKYMGMTLKHPVVPSASPLSKSLDGIRTLEFRKALSVSLLQDSQKLLKPSVRAGFVIHHGPLLRAHRSGDEIFCTSNDTDS